MSRKNGNNGNNGMKRKHIKTYLLVGIAAVIVALIIYKAIPSRTGAEIHIAYAGPYDDGEAEAGRLMTRAIQLHLDKINRAGGVRGKKVVLDIFDDEDNPVKARENAVKMAKENNILAVIGHWYSSCSISAGEVYKKHKIPAISPGSTHMEVTRDNPWYFRTYLNIDMSCKFLVTYIKDVLGEKRISIIHEDGTYLKHTRAIKKNASKSDLELKYSYGFRVGDRDLDQRLRRIVADLKTRKDAGFIILTVQAREGVKLLKLLKDSGIENPVLGPASFSEKTFIHGFRAFPNERKNPGYYTNGVHVVTPLIFDTANEKAQKLKQKYQSVYGEKPDWSVAFAYDSAQVLVDAIIHGGVEGEPGSASRDREKIRKYLTGLDKPERAMSGATGLNYFNEHGDVEKPIYVGVYRNGNLISTMAQIIQPIRYFKEIPSLKEAWEKKRIIKVNDIYIYKTNVVYVGVEFNKISELDFEKLSCKLDFHIWFRFREEIDASDIIFLNALKPIRLTSADLIKTEKKDDLTFQLYRVKGWFETDFLGERRGDELYHTLGFGFRHRELNRNSLIYVTDVLGMGLDGAPSFQERMAQDAVISPEYGWRLDEVWFFQDIIKKSTMGDLNYLDIQNKFVDCSRFNFLARVKKEELLPRRKLPFGEMRFLLVISVAMLLLLFIAAGHKFLGRYPRSIWLFQLVFGMLILLSSEVVFLHIPVVKTDIHFTSWLIRAFDVLWWAIPALFARLALEPFIWGPLQKRTQRPVPNVLRRFVRFIIYFIALYGIVVFAFQQNINNLMATSGVIAMVIGFIVKANISDFFSGIMINQGSAVRIGDWVKVGDFGEGKVMDITWRSTRLQVVDGSFLTIPNSDVLGSTVCNYNYPVKRYRLEIAVEIDPVHRYDRVRKILVDAALSVKDVLKDPGPDVVFKGQGDFKDDREESTLYGVSFSVMDYGKKEVYKAAVWKRVWTHLAYAGIRLARIPGDGMLRRDGERLDPIRVLESMKFFREIGHEARSAIARRMQYIPAPVGEPFIREGARDETVYIIVEGAVGVWAALENGQSVEASRRGAGEIIGEMSLLSGEPRTASLIPFTETFLFKITKEDLAPVMAAHPRLVKELGEIQFKRVSIVEVKKKAERSLEKEEETPYPWIIRKIFSFFPGKKTAGSRSGSGARAENSGGGEG